MSAPKEGNSALTLTDGDGQTHTALLNRPLHFDTVPSQHTLRYSRDSLDLTAREVISIGSGRTEVETTLRFDANADMLLQVLSLAADGNTVTYYPDLTIGTGYDLWLVSEGPVVSLQHESGRSSFQEHMKRLRFRAVNAGSLEALFSPWLFKFTGGVVPRYGVFTRSGAVGKYTNVSGVLSDAAADIPRIEWEYAPGDVHPSEPGLLLESPAFVNLVSSDNFDSGWTSSGTPAVAATSDTDLGGYTIEDDAAGATEFKYLAVTFTGDGVKSYVVVVRENTFPSGGVQRLGIWDDSASAYRGTLNITAWTDGEPTVAAGTGTLLGKHYLGAGRWAIYALTSSVTASNTHHARVLPAADTASHVGDIDVFRFNTYNSASPPWSILDEGETKNAETFYAGFAHVPQAMSMMIDFRELRSPPFTTESTASRRVMQISASDNSDPRLTVFRNATTDSYAVVHDTGASSVTSTVDIDPAWGDRIQIAWWLFADGSVQIAARKQALGSTTWSAWTTGAASSALPLASAWSGERLYLGSIGTVGRGSQIFRRVLIAQGSGLTTTRLLELAT